MDRRNKNRKEKIKPDLMFFMGVVSYFVLASFVIVQSGVKLDLVKFDLQCRFLVVVNISESNMEMMSKGEKTKGKMKRWRNIFLPSR